MVLPGVFVRRTVSQPRDKHPLHLVGPRQGAPPFSVCCPGSNDMVPSTSPSGDGPEVLAYRVEVCVPVIHDFEPRPIRRCPTSQPLVNLVSRQILSETIQMLLVSSKITAVYPCRVQDDDLPLFDTMGCESELAPPEVRTTSKFQLLRNIKASGQGQCTCKRGGNPFSWRAKASLAAFVGSPVQGLLTFRAAKATHHQMPPRCASVWETCVD